MISSRPWLPNWSILRRLIARAMRPGEWGKELARMLLVRYAVEAAIDRATSLSVELLGGMVFIGSPEVPYLLAAHELPAGSGAHG